MRRLLTFALLLVLLAVPLAPAQEQGDVSLSLQPDSAEAEPGASVQTTLSVRNGGLQPQTVRLRAVSAEDVSVTIAQPQLNVLPAQTVTTTAVLVVNASALAQTHVVRFIAEWGSSGAGGPNVTADFTLRIVEPAPVAAKVAPTQLNVTGIRNVVTAYVVDITNPAMHEQTFAIRQEMPAGWEHRAGPERVTLARNTTQQVRFELVALSNAPADASGLLVVTSGAMSASVQLRLHSPPPAFSIRVTPLEQTVEPGAVAEYLVTATAAEALTLDLRVTEPAGFPAQLDRAVLQLPAGGSGETVLRVHAPQEGGLEGIIGLNATSRSTGEEHSIFARLRVVAQPPADAEPATHDNGPGEIEDTPLTGPDTASEHTDAEPETEPHAQTLPSITLEPTELAIAPGSLRDVRVLVRIAGGEAREVALTIEWPPLFSGGFSQGTWILEPGVTHETLLEVEAGETAPIGGTYSARVHLDDGSASSTLRLRVVPPDSGGQVDASLAKGEERPAPAGLLVGAAVLVGATFLATPRARRGVSLLAAALYTRLAPGRILAHPVRLKLMEHVREMPGIAVGELQRRLGIANGAMAYHVRVLERGSHLVSVSDGQLRRLYPTGVQRAAPAGNLSDRALDALAREGPMTAADLARRLGVSRQALHYHLKRLQAEGRIAPDEGKALRLVAEVNLPR